jgi:SAM-dependent methyltransferase
MGERCDRDALAVVYRAGVREYDEIWSPVILPPAVAMVDALDIADARRVLDVGSGTGALLAVLSAAAPHAHITAIEPSAEMLAYAVTRRTAMGVRADAAALPFRSGTADAVILAYVLFHLVDPGAGVREAARVLRPDGQVGTVTWKRELPSPVGAIWERAFEEFRVPDFAAHGNHGGLDSSDAIERLFIDAGVQPERIWYERIQYTFEPEDFWRLRTGCGRSRARLALLDEPTRRRVLDDVRQRLATARSDDFTFSGELVCATGCVHHTDRRS